MQMLKIIHVIISLLMLFLRIRTYGWFLMLFGLIFLIATTLQVGGF